MLKALALGDPHGEQRRPSRLPSMVGGGPFGLKPGQWTDGTSMALCLAESLIERRGFDAKDQMERYCRWMNDGHFSVKGYCFDVGATTAQALHRFERTGEPYAGSTDPHAAGNGSLVHPELALGVAEPIDR